MQEHKVLSDDLSEKELLELEERGKVIDEIYAQQQFVKTNADFFKDHNEYFLYRLPLTETQRKAVYESVMRQRKKKEDRLKTCM